MKVSKSFVCAGLVISGIASSLAPASAIPYKGDTVYKATDRGIPLVVFSASPGSRIRVNLGSSAATTARVAGACGELRISVPASGSFTGLKVDGTAVDASTLPTQTLPSCVSGTFAETRSANFKTPAGQVIIVGKTPNSAVSIELPQPTVANVSVNACGFGILRQRTGQTLPATFSTDSTSYTMTALKDASTPPLCRTAGGAAAAYIPSTWTP
ncbi:hypothetical protein CAL7716_057690 [Calothrix sp. PCC 7716]|nr:hypothetical protein CAL7716_057690 [Calothrix sp. PCC 7716]